MMKVARIQKRNVAMVAWSAVAATAAPAWAGSHLWRFNEIFSNADGTIQFIEMKECCGASNEIFLGGKWVDSAATGMIFYFPADLPCTECTANKHLLLATQSFANLPGAPTPDFIIPSHFFSLQGDTLRYWLYGSAYWTYPADVVPTDGIHALNLDGSIGVNSPTNFAGGTGSVSARCNPADVIADGRVDINDLLAVITGWGPCAYPDYCPPDLAPSGGDDQVNVDDLIGVINAWGPCQ